MTGRVVRWMAVAAWCAAIFAVSSVPGSSLPGGYATQAHFTEYLVLGFLLYWAIRPATSTRRALLLAVAIASLYGVSDELHQAFVPLRTPDPLDWMVDTLGAASGAALAWWVERLRLRSKD